MDVMQQIKKIFPFSFKATDPTGLVVALIIYIVVCGICGAIIGLLASIPVAGIIFSLIGSILGLYGLMGIVLTILVFLKVVQ